MHSIYLISLSLSPSLSLSLPLPLPVSELDTNEYPFSILLP